MYVGSSYLIHMEVPYYSGGLQSIVYSSLYTMHYYWMGLLDASACLCSKNIIIHKLRFYHLAIHSQWVWF